MTPDTRPLPPDLQSLLDAEMRPSETLLWAGQPTPERWTRPNMLFGRAIGNLLSRAGLMPRLAYCITNQRALIVIIVGNNPLVRTLEPQALMNRTIVEKPDGLSDIMFPDAPKQDVKFAKGVVGFYGIPDVRGVDDLLARTFDPPA